MKSVLSSKSVILLFRSQIAAIGSPELFQKIDEHKAVAGIRAAIAGANEHDSAAFKKQIPVVHVLNKAAFQKLAIFLLKFFRAYSAEAVLKQQGPGRCEHKIAAVKRHIDSAVASIALRRCVNFKPARGLLPQPEGFFHIYWNCSCSHMSPFLRLHKKQVCLLFYIYQKK